MLTRTDSEPLTELCHDLLRSVVTLLELRNPYCIDHCKLVAFYCDRLAREMGLAESDRERLVRAAEIHTLGVLLQMEEKKTYHALPIGQDSRQASIHQREEQILRRLVGRLPQLEGCLEILLQRHEWFDGSGSMYGLKGEEILPAARLFAVADAFVDLATPKAHRPPEPTPNVIQRIEEQAGTQFDPTCVAALLRVLQGEGKWGAAERAEHFQMAHCRHYLDLGHFYTQIHESDWALRSYLAAEKMALGMGDRGLAFGALTGQFMVFCDRGELERAREALQRARGQQADERERQAYHLYWGLLEWLSGREDNGRDIVARAIERYAEGENLPGLTAALALQANMLLLRRGADDPEHLAHLRRFMDLVATHDVFDVVERYRPYTIPLFINSIIQEIHPVLGRGMLTRMGEPCHAALHRRLRHLPPGQWVRALMPEPVIPTPAPHSFSSQTGLAVMTLGRLEVRRGEAIFSQDDFPTRKTMKLFARLCLARGTPLTDDFLMELLWGDTDPVRARNSLRNALHQVRHTVRRFLDEPGATVVGRSRKNQTVVLELDYGLDFEDFEAAIESSTSKFSHKDWEGALKSCRRALELYRGDFLEGVDAEWVLTYRARFREARNRLLLLSTRCHLELGACEAAELTAREAIGRDDLREESHALLIEALARDGRSREAVEHYEKAVQLFESEIGVTPRILSLTLERLGLLL